MKALAVALLALSCASHVPPESPAVVVYQPGYGPAPALLAPAAFVVGGPSVSRIPVPAPPPDPDHAREVYAYNTTGSAPAVVYAPTPRAAVVIVRDLPPSQRKHTRWHYDRAVERCDRRATKWARERCYRREAR